MKTRLLLHLAMPASAAAVFTMTAIAKLSPDAAPPAIEAGTESRNRATVVKPEAVLVSTLAAPGTMHR